jgi:hypothetical protein
MLVLRRIRGLLGIAVVWGAAISAVGTAFILTGFATGWISPIPGTGWTRWITVLAGVAARDFLGGTAAGAAFAMLLTGAERRRTIENLSLRRVGAWGFLAAALPTSIVAVVSGAIIPPATLVAGTIATGVLGAGLGVAMVRVARRPSVALADFSQS